MSTLQNEKGTRIYKIITFVVAMWRQNGFNINNMLIYRLSMVRELNTFKRFKSSFKIWIRIVASILLGIFLLEQVAQAVEYDWRILWQKPALNTFIPSYIKDIHSIDIPLTIKKILKDISGKPINAIKISDNFTIELERPLNISKQRIEEFYNWLKGSPCGTKALYDFLAYKGVQVIEQDIAVLALTVDILNDVVKPLGNPKVIKNSLYALSKVSEFFGYKLYPVKIDINPQLPTPFLAHLKSDHYILVSRITEDKVYFLDEHKEEFLPKEKFLNEFSGYALISTLSSLTHLISEKEAKEIRGAGDLVYFDDVADYSSYYTQSSYTVEPFGINFTLYNGSNVSSVGELLGFVITYKDPHTDNYVSFLSGLISQYPLFMKMVF
jgi:hypothetical protein